MSTLNNITYLKLLKEPEKDFDQITYTYEYNGPVTDTCPYCGSKLYNHGTQTLKYTDIPEDNLLTKIVVQVPRKRCKNPNCKSTWRPILDFEDSVLPLTKAATVDIINSALDDTFASVSERYHCAENTIKNYFTKFFNTPSNLKSLKFKTPVILGIKTLERNGDELAVLIDLEHNTYFDIIVLEDMNSLINYFNNMNDTSNITTVLIDTDLRTNEKADYKVSFLAIRELILNFSKVNINWYINSKNVKEGLNKALEDELYSDKYIDSMDLYTKTNLINFTYDSYISNDNTLEDLKNNQSSVVKKIYQLKTGIFDLLYSNDKQIDKILAFNKLITSKQLDKQEHDYLSEYLETLNKMPQYIFNNKNVFIKTNIQRFNECINTIMNNSILLDLSSSFTVVRARALYSNILIKEDEESGDYVVNGDYGVKV